MIGVLSRRRFLKFAGASAAAVLAAPSLVWAREYAPIHYTMHGFDEDLGEESIIRESMNILHTRFRSMEVLRNAYRVANRGQYNLGAGVWESSNLDEHPTYTKTDLLWAQITILRQPNDEDDDEPEFPNVQIHAFHEKSDILGRAPVGTVVVKYVGDQNWRQSGEFTVKLNRWHLGARGRYSDPEEWAAIIAHEMLHNLGHKHQDEDGDYPGDWQQIIAFEKAVRYNASYDRSALLKMPRSDVAVRMNGPRCGCGLPLTTEVASLNSTTGVTRARLSYSECCIRMVVAPAVVGSWIRC